MEITTKRCIVLAVLLLAFGTLARLQPTRTAPWRTERWMEDALPTEIPGFRMDLSAEKPRQSYDAGERQYKMLLPYGIVCRVFRKGETGIDTVVIAGNDRDTFHDPYFCLPGQDWKITSSHEGVIQTKTRGTVPVSSIALEHPQFGKRRAIFCYRGPTKYHPTQNSLYLDWFTTELKLGKPPEGAFFRFMSVSDDVQEKDLLEFAAVYLDAATAMNGGVL